MLKGASAFMALLLLVSLFAACGGNTGSDNPANTTVESVSEASAEAETTAASVNYKSANLPEKDYNGYEFCFIQPKPTYDDTWWYIDVDDQNGEPLNDAVYKRNAAIEEAFNVKVTKLILGDNSTTLSSAQKSINAGDDAFSALHINFAGGSNLSQSGMLIDLNTVQYMDLTQDWWDQSFIEQLTINNKIYWLTGDISLIMKARAYSLVFNKDLCDTLQMEYPYQSVLDGTWTVDYFTKFVKGVNADVNGDGVMDYEDRWGFFSENIASYHFFNGFGGCVIEVGNDGKLKSNLEDEKNINRLIKALEVIIDKEATVLANPYVNTHDGGWKAASAWYASGNALIRSSTFEAVPRDYRTMESDFGVLPFPKLDESQEYYHTCASDSGYLIAIPVTSSDVERAGIILEGLSAESVETVKTAFYDVCLAGKYMRDEESAAMLDIIFGHLTYDLSYMLSLGGMRDQMIKLENAYSTDITSKIAAISKSMDAAISGYMEAYE